MSWGDLDSFIASYEQSRQLPPILGRELPAKYDTLAHSLPELLSPTLPKQYELGPEARPGTLKRRNEERYEYYGRNGYRLATRGDKSELVVTLYVPKYYKSKRAKVSGGGGAGSSAGSASSTASVGLGITQREAKDAAAPPVAGEKSVASAAGAAGVAGAQRSVFHKTKQAKKPVENGSGVLTLKNEQYLRLAKQKKHRGDAVRDADVKLGICCFVDSIITYLVGFQFEDLCRKKLKKLYNDKTWLSLVFLVDHSLKLCQNNGFMDIYGLLLKIKGLTYEHVSSIVEEYVLLNQSRRAKRVADSTYNGELDAVIEGHVKNYIKYKSLSRKEMAESEQYLSVFQLQERYAQVVAQRVARADTEFDLDVRKWRCQLPIMIGSDLQSLCVLSAGVMRQWSAAQGVQYADWVL